MLDVVSKEATMGMPPHEDGLAIVVGDPDARTTEPDPPPEDGDPADPADAESQTDSEARTLCDAFVDAFNARDLDSVVGLVAEDVECPDAPGDGIAVLCEELEAIWERSPGAVLTSGRQSDGVPCAVAWLPDEDGCWSRAALVCFDVAGGLITLVAVPDDADALERADTREPTGEELDEWLDWNEWETGAETVSRPRRRIRP